MTLSTDFFNFRCWQLLIAYALLFSVIGWLTNSLVYTDAFYYSTLGDKLSSQRIEEIIASGKKYQWAGYIALPLLLLLKWIMISGVLYMGLFLFNQNVSFANCVKIILVAEMASLISALVKLICFIMHRPETVEDIQYFSPLSITQLFSAKQLSSYLVYPLQQFNVFEIIYWCLIAFGIQAYIKGSFRHSLKIVASSYGLALCVWVLFVVFIQLQFS